MMLRYLLVTCFLIIFAVACAPVALDTAEPQTADSAESSDMAQEAEEEHSDEDADEHGEEGDHSDEEESDEHGHDGDGERRELGAHEHGVAELMIAWSGNDVAIDLQTPAFNVLGFEYEPTSDEEKALMAESVAALEAGGLLQLSPEAGCTLVSATVQTAYSEEGHDEESHSEEGHDEDAEGHDGEGHDEDAEGHSDEEGHDEDGEGHSDEEGHDEDAEGHDGEGHDEDAEGHDGEGHGEEGHDEDDHSEEVHSDIDVSYNLECQQPENLASVDASALFAQFPNFEDIDVQWISDTQQSAGELTPDNPTLSLE
ncbi:MAG: DUF2796 domain-containing protein [Chloroflexota bacterium]